MVSSKHGRERDRCSEEHRQNFSRQVCHESRFGIRKCYFFPKTIQNRYNGREQQTISSNLVYREHRQLGATQLLSRKQQSLTFYRNSPPSKHPKRYKIEVLKALMLRIQVLWPVTLTGILISDVSKQCRKSVTILPSRQPQYSSERLSNMFTTGSPSAEVTEPSLYNHILFRNRLMFLYKYISPACLAFINLTLASPCIIIQFK